MQKNAAPRMRAYQNHALQCGLRQDGLTFELTFECLCGRVLARVVADQATHVEFSAVCAAGVRAAVLDAREPWHGRLAETVLPDVTREVVDALAAEDITERTELPGGLVVAGSGTSPNFHNPSAAVSLNPS
jgi:hypothetical protein